MRKRLLPLLLALTMGLSTLTGCAGASAATDLMQDIKANDISIRTDISSGVEEMTRFGVSLFQTAHETGENTLISPLSVLSALGMTANGAKGNTLLQMEQVFGLSVEELNELLYSYIARLPQTEDSKLTLANSIWFRQEEFAPDADFLQIVADYYSPGVYAAPFDSSTVNDINNWVKKHTDGMIPKVLNEISEDVMMYLINALAFDAKWQEEYEKAQVREGEFTLETGEIQAVDLMWSEESTYLQDDTTRGFIKYYKGHDYAFVALLPNEGISISDYTHSLTGDKLRNLLDTAEYGVSVTAAIPKFTSEYSTELSEVLQTMGMNDAFDGDYADLSGLGDCPAGNLYISRVLHKTFIDVSEQGTRAAAVTAVEVNCESAAVVERVETVVLDRPFLYLLVDCENQLPIFIGTLMNPGGEVVGQVEELSYGGDAPVEASSGQTVYEEWNYANISMTLPKGWEYEVSDPGETGGPFGIAFWPEEHPEGKISLSYQEFFGVCGTGLVSEDIVLPGGLKGWQGTYDNHRVWDFIKFQEQPGEYVALNEGAEIWWEDYGETAMEILDSLVFGQGVISESEAVAIATNLREQSGDVWNNTRISFDRETGQWSVTFHGDSDADGEQTVIIDHAGNVVENRNGTAE